MPVDISEMISVLVNSVKAATTETLSDDVLVQFVCQTGEDEHDPDAEPDDAVRPSHAAFHGCIFSMSEAPVPPLDYGCRCAIRYVAAKDTPASDVLSDEATEEPTTPAAATKAWLQENAKGYETLLKIAEKSAVKEAIANVTEKAKKLGNDNPRIIAEMVIDTMGAD